MPFTEEKFQEVSKVLDTIIEMEDTLYGKATRKNALLVAMIGLINEVSFLEMEVSKIDTENKDIQAVIRNIYEEVKWVDAAGVKVQDFPPYIEKSKQRIQEVRTYLEGKRGKPDVK
jgi:hypothetical protein